MIHSNKMVGSLIIAGLNVLITYSFLLILSDNDPALEYIVSTVCASN